MCLMGEESLGQPMVHLFNVCSVADITRLDLWTPESGASRLSRPIPTSDGEWTR